MLMLREPLLFLLLMCFCNEGKSETDIQKIQTAETIQEDSYCATFDETSGKCYNFRQKRSPLDENATTESAIPLESTELNNETVIKMEIHTDQPISSNSSINASTTDVNISELNSSDINNSSTESTTVITYTVVNSTNSTSEMPENIFDGRNDSQNCSTLLNKNADNSTDTQFELTETNNELTQNCENYTESESRITNSSKINYSVDVNNTININESLVLTNLTAETQAANVTSNYTSEKFTTEKTFDSTTDRNARRKREIQNPVSDENKSNGSITQNSTELYSVNPVEYNNVTNQNVTLLKDNDSEFNFVNSTESTINELQNTPSNLTNSNYNVTENADNVVNSSNIYMNKNETNITDFKQTIKENVTTTNFTDNSVIDTNNTLTENVINITDTERIMTDQNQQMITKQATNNLTESVVTNVTTINSTDSASQNVSDENERLKRGIDSILIHTAQNKTNVNTTSNTTDVAAELNDLAESSLIISTSQSTVPEAEKACLIQGEECTNSTECCEHFECTMFDFIKWSKNCDFKPKDTQLTSPPPDVRIPKQPIQLQRAL